MAGHATARAEIAATLRHMSDMSCSMHEWVVVTREIITQSREFMAIADAQLNAGPIIGRARDPRPIRALSKPCFPAMG
jgi:hypothetical protein